MEPTERYMVFRMPDNSDAYTKGSIPTFWGWSRSKAVIKVFRHQRDQKKYKIMIMDEEDIAKHLSENLTDDSTMINWIELGNTETGEMIPFFTTKVEMETMEIKIQSMVSDACSLKDIPNMTACIEAILNLRDEYAKVLELIGFQPKELSYIFDSVNERDDPYSIEGISDRICESYEFHAAYPEDNEFKHKVIGAQAMTSLARQIIYSIQSAVAVLRDDL